MAKESRRRIITVGAVFACVLLVAAAIAALCLRSIIPDADVAASYPIEPSFVDFDADGIEDYGDLFLGARAEAERAPVYDSAYYEGGYPPDDRGACTDTVWRAFAAAGYDLKAMVDADIARDRDAYADVASNPDPNIDFRRVGVLNVFFSRYAQEQSVDSGDAASWQAGDIVMFGNREHVGIVSALRDAGGTPFIIHNMGQPFREENYLAYPWALKPTACYRFDASKIPTEVLVAYAGVSDAAGEAPAGDIQSAAALRVSCCPSLGPASAAYTMGPSLMEEARKKTYLAEEAGNMLPPEQRTWLMPDEL